MKKIIFFIIFIFCFYSRGNSENLTPFEILLGMRNSHYGFLGMEWKKRMGFIVENSLLVQQIELQYFRIAPFYKTNLLKKINLNYSFYMGSRYDSEFYDFGSRLEVSVPIHSKFLIIDGIIQPFYDSNIGKQLGYLIEAKSFIFPEIALFFNYKNLPEYRTLENRISVGLEFMVQNLSVKPEISTPTAWEKQWSRVSVSFLYKYHI